MDRIYDLTRTIGDRIFQMAFSILGGLFLAFEATTLLFFVPCMLTLIIDIISAVALSKRVKRKYPNNADGKFKSSYKTRVMMTIILVFLGIILAHYIDFLYFNEGIWTQLFVMGVFGFYELWSILENYSSENEDSKFAKALQRIMVNKAERHLNVPKGTIANVLLNRESHRKKNDMSIYQDDLENSDAVEDGIEDNLINTDNDTTHN